MAVDISLGNGNYLNKYIEVFSEKRICFSHQVQAYNNTVTNSNTQASFQFNAQDQSQCQLKLNLAAKGDPSPCRVMVASYDDTSQFINLAIPQNEK